MNAQLRIRAQRQRQHPLETVPNDKEAERSIVEFLVFVDPTSLLFLGSTSLKECCIEAIEATCSASESFEYVSHHVELIDTIPYDPKDFQNILIKHID